MNSNLQNAAALAGRILIAALFVWSGWHKITGFDGSLAYMTNAGLPFPYVLLIMTIALELGGGLLLIAGFQTRWVALAIFLFLIPVTAVFHQPTTQPQLIHFLKNLSIMGAMLHLVAFGAGAWSMDGKRK